MFVDFLSHGYLVLLVTLQPQVFISPNQRELCSMTRAAAETIMAVARGTQDLRKDADSAHRVICKDKCGKLCQEESIELLGCDHGIGSHFAQGLTGSSAMPAIPAFGLDVERF